MKLCHFRSLDRKLRNTTSESLYISDSERKIGHFRSYERVLKTITIESVNRNPNFGRHEISIGRDPRYHPSVVNTLISLCSEKGKRGGNFFWQGIDKMSVKGIIHKN